MSTTDSDGAFTKLKDGLVLLFLIIWYYLEALYRTIVPVQLKSIKGEIVLVTGGGRGIGREIAKQISRLQIRAIAIWDLDLATAQETAKEIQEETGIKSVAIQCNVSDRKEVAKAAQETREKVGPVSILVNNAGIMPCKPILKHTPLDIENIFKVNVFSQFWTIFEFLPDFLSQGKGHIVAMSSTAGATGTPNLTGYCSSKYAVKGLMDALFLEMLQDHPNSNIKLTTIHPFVVNTGLAHKPKTRFEFITPFTEPNEAARVILDGMRREEVTVFIPRHLLTLFGLSNVFPLKVKLAVFKFLGCGVDEHDE